VAADPATVSVIFHGLIEDLSTDSLKLSALAPPGSAQRTLLKRVVRVPETSAADIEAVAKSIVARYERSAPAAAPLPRM